MSSRLSPASVIAALLGLLLSAGDLRARDFGASAAMLGSGDAGISSSSGTAALYANPAGMAGLMMYSIETGYDYSNPQNGHGFHASLSDSRTNQYVSAGLSYAYANAKADQFMGGRYTYEGHHLRVALASGYRSRAVAILFGAGLKYYKVSRTPEANIDTINMDVGALLSIMDLVRIGVVGYNVIVQDDRTAMPISLGLGISFNYGGLVGAFDTVLDFRQTDNVTPIYRLGLEYFLAGMLALRTGFEFDQLTDARRVTTGIGYISSAWGIDVGYRQNVQDQEDALVAVTLRFFIP